MTAMNITEAYAVAKKQLTNEPEALAVTVEFTERYTGLTKYLKVWRSDQIEVLKEAA